MIIKVNGEEKDFEGGSVEQLLIDVTGSAPESGVAVAVNGSVVPQSRWSQDIEPGDEVDILVAVQGG